MGGTMRLGADPVKLHPGTRAREIYGEAVIYERHRHRYEVNNFLRRRLEAAGLVVSGTTPDERLVEIIELPGAPVLRRVAVPPGVQVAPGAPGAAVPRVRRRRPALRARAPPARAARHRRADPRAPARGRRALAGAAARADGPLPAALTCGPPATPSARGSTTSSPRSAGSRARSGARPRSPRTSRASSRAWASPSRPTRAATCWRGSTAAPTAPSCSARTSTPSRSTARSSPSSSTAAGRTRTTRSSAPTTRRRVAVFLEVARRASVEGSPVAIELLLTRRGGGRAARREGVRRLGPARRLRLRARPRDADRRDRDRLADLLPAQRRLPRPRGARRHPARDRPQRDRRRRPGDRRDAARPDRRADDRERRLDPAAAAAPRTSCRSAARCWRRRARSTPTASRTSSRA